MSNPARCTCTRCTIRALMGPVIVTALGVLFLLGEFGDGRFSFGRTYPALLMVIGALLLASALAPMEGHVEAPAAVSPPVPPRNLPDPSKQGQ